VQGGEGEEAAPKCQHKTLPSRVGRGKVADPKALGN